IDRAPEKPRHREAHLPAFALRRTACGASRILRRDGLDTHDALGLAAGSIACERARSGGSPGISEMGLRDVLLFLIILGGVPFMLRRPLVGIIYWVWIGL